MSSQNFVSSLPSKAPSQPTYQGVQYPLRTDGLLNLVVDEFAINSGLWQLLMTEPGERLMELDFGTPIRDLLFEQEVQSVYDEIADRVTMSIAKWEPRIVLPYPVSVSKKLSELYVDAMQPYKVDEIENGVFVFFRWQFKAKLDELFQFSAAVTRSAPGTGFGLETA